MEVVLRGVSWLTFAHVFLYSTNFDESLENVRYDEVSAGYVGWQLDWVACNFH